MVYHKTFIFMLSCIHIRSKSDKKKAEEKRKRRSPIVNQAFLKLDVWCESTRGLNNTFFLFQRKNLY